MEENMGKVTELNEANFEKEVLQSDIPVLVDFWAIWCAPCRMIAPTIDALAEEFEGKVKVCKVNVDENPNLAVRFSIRAIPTLLLFKEGKVVEQLVGVQPKEILISILNRYVS
jgi:thioredoxin 1